MTINKPRSNQEIVNLIFLKSFQDACSKSEKELSMDDFLVDALIEAEMDIHKNNEDDGEEDIAEDTYNIACCPFCGPDVDEKPILSKQVDMVDEYVIDYTIMCPHCAIQMIDEYESEVVDNWNLRYSKNDEEDTSQNFQYHAEKLRVMIKTGCFDMEEISPTRLNTIFECVEERNGFDAVVKFLEMVSES